MNPRQRVMAALAHQPADRIPRFEVWIDALLDELGQPDVPAAHANLGQDGVMLPGQTPPGSNAWRTGVDEWGRVWQDGVYADGVVDTDADLAMYSPPLDYAEQFFDPDAVRAVREAYPDHCHFFGTHVGPFMSGYLAMGFKRFFVRLADDPAFVHRLIDARTGWCIALFRRAVDLGAEVIVMGDDAAHSGGPMISPRMWREFALPYHRRVVEALPVPVIWHSDGDVGPLLPFAVEAGFAGVHGLEPAAGMDLAAVRREYGDKLALIGNLDVRVLCAPDLDAVRREVARCYEQGGAEGGYMFATCNSIFAGMHPAAVREMFRCAAEMG
jgi:uroporphyrinogen decarboxylase